MTYVALETPGQVGVKVEVKAKGGILETVGKPTNLGV